MYTEGSRSSSINKDNQEDNYGTSKSS